MKGEHSTVFDPKKHIRTMPRVSQGEYDALNEVAKNCEKLRLVINALLTELPSRSLVNGEDNFPFRLRVLKAQVEAEKAQSNLKAIRNTK